ncbi:hypothetical protein M408DRAFT_127660 [Serendipita vermifera MAFF 305830]|uniref:Uncharacterized protein n=1 Tax=Serendipita vermifera MAFF 305830 TaxID=933852 RepID=A0A0C2XJ16_SERVB|nr:hypothetical protein M408DRAFT_127660 [Serendipita vermifera MAFF 305830]
MEDEKREVKNAGKSVEQIHKEPLRHPLPARPIVTDLRPLAPAPARTHKHSASNGREITIQGAQLLGKSILTSSLTTKPSSSASLKSRMVNGTAAESTESEQQPVPFFLEEKDTRDHSQREHSATRVGYIPLGNSKVPSEQVPLIDRMSMGTHGSSTTASLRSPEDTVANRGLWKRLTPSEAAKDHGQEPVKLPLKSPMNLVTGNAKLPPTGPKHRENAKNFGGPNGTRNYPNISYKAPGHLPPTEPRSMRQTASNALAPQPDPQRTTTSPVTPSTSDRNQVLQATEPPNLDVGEPAKPKPAELPKQDKNFQSLASFTYKQAIISVALKGLGNEGLLIKGFPICPQRCNAGSPNPDVSLRS